MEGEATDFFAATFSIEEEDHTLANSLRFFLNKKCVDRQGRGEKEAGAGRQYMGWRVWSTAVAPWQGTVRTSTRGGARRGVCRRTRVRPCL